MIVSAVRIVAGPKTRDEMLAILFSAKGPTESEPKCISCRIYTEPRNEKNITYEEVWQDKASLCRHLRSPHYRRVLAAIDLSSEPPEVKIATVLKTEGMEVLQRVLGKTDPIAIRWTKAVARQSDLKEQDPDRVNYPKKQGGKGNDIS